MSDRSLSARSNLRGPEYDEALIADLTAERDRYRDALLTIGERVMAFGGFQRTPRGEFWVSRDDVLRLVDEVGRAALDQERHATPHGYAHADDDTPCMEPVWCSRAHVRTPEDAN